VKKETRFDDIQVQIRDASIANAIPRPPDDPDDFGEDGNLNDKRAGWAKEAVIAFVVATGSDLEDAVADLIGDLGHFCDRHGMNLRAQIERGEEFYNYETQNAGKSFEEEE
jgi:hypothetical protein